MTGERSRQGSPRGSRGEPRSRRAGGAGGGTSRTMTVASRIGRHGLWLLLALVAAGLALLVTRIAARGRAAEAMSAGLLAPLDTAAHEPAAPGSVAAEAGAERPSDPDARPPEVAAARLESGADPAAAGDSLALADSAEAAARRLPPLDPELFPDWTGFGEAVPLARRGERAVLLAFSTYGCEQCEQLAREVFRDEAAGVTLRSAVVPVAVADPLGGEGDPAREAGELQRRFGVTSFPTLVLYFPATGRVRKLEGYPGRDRTLRWVTESSASPR